MLAVHPTIVTKYLPPTDTKGARVKATWQEEDRKSPYRTLTLPFECSWEEGENHRFVAAQLATGAGLFRRKPKTMLAGTLDTGYIFLVVPK